VGHDTDPAFCNRALDRHSPYAWCVLGNCFSLQKEHETALRYFQRALQLDPTLPYAYTLAGAPLGLRCDVHCCVSLPNAPASFSCPSYRRA
jgi:tetratricopeptide (TPR) repeat protein